MEIRLNLTKNKVFLAVFLISCFFIFYGLTWHDAISDEAINAFRSIGYYDHLVSQLQTTPYQWFAQVPWWAKLSFHDAPYLSFLIQHIFFKIFGVSLLVMRLPFALAGIGLILALYLFFQKFVDKKFAWLPAVLLVANAYHLWSAKLGYLEILTSFFIWLSIYFFFKIKQGGRNFYWWALFLALALVTKYTAFFMLPVYLFYGLLFERRLFKDKRFYLALLIIFLIFSPVLIYNLMMFRATGHFDLQFSALFGQQVKAWSKISRRAGGNFFASQLNVFRTLIHAWGAINFILFILGLVFLLIRALLAKGKIASFFVIMSLCFLICFAFIGGGTRFLSLFNPLLAVILALAIFSLRRKLKKPLIWLLVSILIGYNLFISFNTLVFAGGLSKNGLLFSQPLVLKSYGYNQLEKAIKAIIKKEKPFIGKAKDNTLFIFDSNINYFPKVWYIQRWVSYELIPFASTNEVLEVLKEKGNNYYFQQGFKHFYFIKATSKTFLAPEDARSATAEILEKDLPANAVNIYQKVKNRDGETAFVIYKF